jgi:hypothetical protein
MSSGMAKSPTGGAESRRVIERRSLGLISVEGVVKRENICPNKGWFPLSRFSASGCGIPRGKVDTAECSGLLLLVSRLSDGRIIWVGAGKMPNRISALRVIEWVIYAFSLPLFSKEG